MIFHSKTKVLIALLAIVLCAGAAAAQSPQFIADHCVEWNKKRAGGVLTTKHDRCKRAFADIEEMSREIQKGSSRSSTHYERGRKYDYLDLFNEALADFQKFSQLEPTNSVGYVQISDMYEKLQRYDEALKASSKAIELDPKTESLYRTRERLYEKLGKKAEASADRKRADELKAQDDATSEKNKHLFDDLTKKLLMD